MDYHYFPEKEDFSSDELKIYGKHIEKLHPLVLQHKEHSKELRKKMLWESFNANFQISSPDCYRRENDSFDSDIQHYKKFANSQTVESEKNENNNIKYQTTKNNFETNIEPSIIDNFLNQVSNSCEPSCSAAPTSNLKKSDVVDNVSSVSNDSELVFVDALSDNIPCTSNSTHKNNNLLNVDSYKKEAHQLAMHLQYLNCITSLEPHLLSVVQKSSI